MALEVKPRSTDLVQSFIEQCADGTDEKGPYIDIYTFGSYEPVSKDYMDFETDVVLMDEEYGTFVIPLFSFFKHNLGRNQSCIDLEDRIIAAIKEDSGMQEFPEGFPINNNRIYFAGHMLPQTYYWSKIAELVGLKIESEYYTYNFDNALDRDYIGVEFEFEDKRYLSIQVHVGVDARAGFTEARIYQITADGYLDPTLMIATDDEIITSGSFHHGMFEGDLVWDKESKTYLYKGQSAYVITQYDL